jgi:hypothetical protein
MDAQKLKFMMSIQLEIDKLEAELGSNHQDVIASKALFQKLSQTEIQKKKAENSKSECCDELIPIKLDTELIRSHLEIRANVSIDYDFIKNDRVKKQLIRDNLKMENSRLDIQIKSDTERFYNFCVEAFYQIEELVNYFFITKHPLDAVAYLKTKNSQINAVESDFLKIEISKKLYVVESLFYYGQVDANGRTIRYESTINLIRDVRNEDSHRCNIIEQDNEQLVQKYIDLLKKIKDFNEANKNTNPKVYYQKNNDDKLVEKQAKLINFIKDKNYNLVRDTVFELVNKIKSDLQKI